MKIIPVPPNLSEAEFYAWMDAQALEAGVTLAPCDGPPPAPPPPDPVRPTDIPPDGADWPKPTP